RSQAARSGELIANLILQNKKDFQFYTSDLKRAWESAQIAEVILKRRVSPSIEFVKSPLLREFHVGHLQGHTRLEYESINKQVLEKYFSDYKTDADSALPPGEGAESRDMVAKRTIEFLNSLKGQPAVICG